MTGLYEFSHLFDLVGLCLAVFSGLNINYAYYARKGVNKVIAADVAFAADQIEDMAQVMKRIILVVLTAEQRQKQFFVLRHDHAPLILSIAK